MEKNPIETIQELSEGYSKQTKTANQIWIFLMITSIYSLAEKDRQLPFGMGEVNEFNFRIMCAIIISVISIAYTSAMIQSIRTRKLIQKIIDNLGAEEKFINHIHIEDYVDSILTPSYNKVAPISQFILGKHQFLGDQAKQNKVIRWIAILFYIILKMSTVGLMYLIPIASVYPYVMYIHFFGDEINVIDSVLKIIAFFLVYLASFSFLILILGEIKVLIRVIKKIGG